MTVPDKVKKALLHVRQYHPTVVQVFYSINGKWLYCDEDFYAPPFESKYVDTRLLEEAVASLERLPAAFSLKD